MAKLSAAEIEQNKRIQRELREAGYPIKVDGVLGPETRAAHERLKAEQAEKARLQAETSAAEAASRKAEADARAREKEAEAEATRAQAEAARAKADEKKRKDEAAEAARQRLFDTAVKTGSIAAGFAASVLIAKGVEKKVAKSIAIKAPELEKLATQVQSLLPKANAGSAAGQKTIARLGAIVAEAERLGLTKVKRGPAGLILAGGLVVEGLASRAFSQDIDNKTLQTLGVSFGAASIAAGLGVAAKDLYARSIPSAVPNAEHLSQIAQAKAVATAAASQPGAPPPQSGGKPAGDLSKRGRGAVGPSVADLRRVAGQHGIANASRMSKAELIAKIEAIPGGGGRASLAKLGARALLPAIVGIAAVQAFSDSAAAGESTAQAAAAAGGAAATTTADIATGGAVSAYNAARTKGIDEKAAALGAVMEGAGNLVSFGAGSILADIVARAPTKAYVPESVAKARAKREQEERSAIQELAAQQVAARNTAAFVEGQSQAGAAPGVPAVLTETILDRAAVGSGLADFHGGMNAPVELAARQSFMALAADHARTVATREPVQPADRPPVLPPAAGKRDNKGWTDEARAAAYEARLAKGFVRTR